jgi:hypothetical protein
MALDIERIARNRMCNYLISTIRMGNSYETALRKENGPFVVVQQYTTIEDAKKYHTEWVKFCESMPTTVLNCNGIEQSLIGEV